MTHFPFKRMSHGIDEFEHGIGRGVVVLSAVVDGVVVVAGVVLVVVDVVVVDVVDVVEVVVVHERSHIVQAGSSSHEVSSDFQIVPSQTS